MWLPLVAFIVCLSANAAAQCPIQVRQASLDTTGRSVTIRYYNAAPHVAYDVQFVLLSDRQRFVRASHQSAHQVVQELKIAG